MVASSPPKLGRYEIVEEIGKGAMGVVYLARDPLIGRLVALKTFRVGFSVGDDELEQFRARFIREAQSAGILSHPNIVTVHDVQDGAADGFTFIAMEYVPGVNLKEILQRDEALELEFIVSVISQVADALDYAHSKGVVHRDVKPANVIIDLHKRVKITDFGIARLESSNLTQDGQLLGTPNYMAPEQILGRDLDHRADVFSLGVVLFELLTHNKPFQGENLTVVSHRIAFEDYTPASQFVPDIDPGLERVLARALEKDPQKRYPSAGELAAALREAAHVAPRATAPERGSPAATARSSAPLPSPPSPPDAPAAQPAPPPVTMEPRRLEAGGEEGAAEPVDVVDLRAELADAVASVEAVFGVAGPGLPPAPGASAGSPTRPPPLPPEALPTAALRPEALPREADAELSPATAERAEDVADLAPAPEPVEVPPPDGSGQVDAERAAAPARAASEAVESWVEPSATAGDSRAADVSPGPVRHRAMPWAAVLVGLLAAGLLAAGLLVAWPDSSPVSPASAETELLGRVMQQLALAAQAEQRGDYAGAVARYREAERLAPDRAGITARRRQAEQLAGQREAAVATEATVAALVAAGDEALTRRRFTEATARAREALSLAPEHAEALALLARAERAEAQAASSRPRSTEASPTTATAVLPPTAPAEPAGDPSAPATLNVDFLTEVSEGALTIYVNQKQVVLEPFRFVRRTGLLRSEPSAGRVTTSRSFPPGEITVQVYATPAGKPARSTTLHGNLLPGSQRSLRIHLDKSGELSASLE